MAHRSTKGVCDKNPDGSRKHTMVETTEGTGHTYQSCRDCGALITKTTEIWGDDPDDE